MRMNLKPLPGIKLYIPLIFFFSCLLVNKSIAQKGFSSTNLVSAAALPDGKILVTTSTLNMTYNSASFGRIGRLHSTGLNDQSFSELEPSSVINASISLQGDKILLFGNSSGSTPDMQRLNSDGTLDNSFTSVVTDGGISTATVLPDNRIVISGTFSVVNNVARTRIAILNSNGTLDNSFVPPTTLGNITHHAVQSNGSIILSGDVTGKLARLNTTGTLDNGFTPNFNQNISHFVIDNSNSRILAVGAFNFISSFNIINGIQAANPLTTTNNSINAIVLEPNTNNIFIAGNFTEVGGITGQNRFAKLSSTGALVNSLIFSTGTGFNNSINRPPVILPNKKIILISSTFTSYNNIPVNSIVQLNENGSLDNSFNNALEVTLNNIAFEREYDATTSATPASASSPGLTGLQPGDNGLVSLTGTPTFTYDNKNVGINKAMTITGYRITGGAAFKYYLNPSTVKGKINPKPLTINGLSATTKIYDGNKSAPFPANQTLTLNGVLNNEVTLNTSGPITAEFTDKNVQNNKTVTFLGYKLDNNSLGNYSLPNPTVTNASITAKTVVFSGVSAKNKVYDGNKSAIIETNPAPSLLFTVSGDLVSINLTNAKAEFADANASQNPKTVTFSGFALKDQDAGNYTFAQPSSKTSLITPKPISISSAVIPNNKTYDGNTNGTFSISDSPPKFSGVISGDVVTLDDANAKANFPNKNFGTYTNTVTFTGFALGGNSAGNYSLTSQPPNSTASIGKRPLTINVGISDKPYDGNKSATLTGDQTLNNVVKTANGSEPITLSGSPTFAFPESAIGGPYTITITGYTLSTNDAANAPTTNYALTTPVVSASILKKKLTISNLKADKVYDGNDIATLSGGTLSGFVGGESATLNYSNVIAKFPSKDVNSYTLTNITGLALGGANPNNYFIDQPTNLPAKITAKDLTLTGVAAKNKQYDGTTDAEIITTNIAFSGLVPGEGAPNIDFSTLNAKATFASKNADNSTAKDVTYTGFTISGGLAGNYNFIQPQKTTAFIFPREVSVKDISIEEKEYNGNVSANFINKGSLDNMVVSEAIKYSLNSANAKADFLTKDVGTNKSLVVSGYTLFKSDGDVNFPLSNYVMKQPTNVPGEIKQKPVNVSVTAIPRVYDGTITVALGNATLSGVIPAEMGSIVLDPNAVTIATVLDKNVAPSKAVTVTGFKLVKQGNLPDISTNNYVVVQPQNLTVQISAKPLTVTGISVASKEYNKTDVAQISGSATLSGLVQDDADKKTVTLNTVGAAAKYSSMNAGGPYAVTISGYTIGGVDAPNYDFKQPTVPNASITQKTVTITGITAQDKTYNGNNTATLSGTAALVGVIPGDLSPTPLVEINTNNIPSATFASINTGSHNITVNGYVLKGSAANNYTIQQPFTLQNKAIINKAPVTISGVTSSNKVYDGNKNAAIVGQATYSGVILDDIASDAIDEAVNVTNAKAEFVDANAGPNKDVIFTGFALAGDPTAINNYQVTQPTKVQAQITQKPLTLTGLSAKDKVYNKNKDAEIIKNNLALSGLVSVDVGAGLVDISEVNPKAVFAFAEVGKHTITFSGYGISGSKAPNYAFSPPTNVQASITPKELEMQGISIEPKVYDGNTNAKVLGTASLISSQILSGDQVGLVTITPVASFVDKNANPNPKDVTISTFTLNGNQAANYKLKQPSLTGFINRKELTITNNTANISIGNKEYDGNTNAIIKGSLNQLDGIVGSEKVTLVAQNAKANFDTKNVANNKPITITGFDLGGDDFVNYTLKQPTFLTANITAKPLTVTGIAVTPKVYDRTKTVTFTNKGTLSGLVASDAALVTLNTTNATAEYSNFNVGNYSLNVTGYTLNGTATDIANYAFTQPQAFSASITPKPLTLSNLTIQDKTYDGTLTAQISGNAGLVGVISPDDVKLNTATVTANFADANVGTNKDVTVSGLTISGLQVANYSLSVTGGNLKGNINAKPLTITGLNANSKVYDGTNTATLVGGTVTGKVGVDDVSLNTTTATATFPSRNKGTNLAVAVTGVILNGGAKGNYSIAQPTNLTANITEKPLTVTGIVVTPKVYDKTKTVTFTNKGTLSGLVASDAALVTLNTTNATAEYSDVNVANYMLNV
ncbi:MAG: YDG domain-containing protein, partial [Chryseotalea sp.]